MPTCSVIERPRAQHTRESATGNRGGEDVLENLGVRLWRAFPWPALRWNWKASSVPHGGFWATYCFYQRKYPRAAQELLCCWRESGDSGEGLVHTFGNTLVGRINRPSGEPVTDSGKDAPGTLTSTEKERVHTAASQRATSGSSFYTIKKIMVISA